MRRTPGGPAQFAVHAVASIGAIAAFACGGGDKTRAPADSTAIASKPSRRVPAIPVTGPPPSGATEGMVIQGDSIFHGRAAGGLCYVCHGADANGTPLAPTLLEHQWLTGSGTYEFIQQRVTEGFAAPTPPFMSPMPPKGGANLSAADIKAVAAYVYAISHPR